MQLASYLKGEGALMWMIFPLLFLYVNENSNDAADDDDNDYERQFRRESSALDIRISS